jgi:hypothetical protein
VEIEALLLSPATYQGQHVVTVGRLDVLRQGLHWSLREASNPILLLLGHELSSSDFDPLLGGRVEVRGIVRRIRPKQYIRGVDVDLIEDPSLPVLPEPSMELPQISITVLSFVERGNHGAKPGPPLEGTVRDILADPLAHADRKVRIVGQFRGSNLFADLPAGSRRGRSDWVVKDGDAAVWVVGKDPRGKGWSLDPSYAGDTARYVAVEGKPEVANGVVYVRASKVTLAAKPASPEEEP